MVSKVGGGGGCGGGGGGGGVCLFVHILSSVECTFDKFLWAEAVTICSAE